MSGGSVIAADAPVFRSRSRRALDIARDLSLAVILVWVLPLIFAVVVGSVRWVVHYLTR
jgi:hypothetical protein